MTERLPMEHIERAPLPWRLDNTMTECGLPTAGHPVLTRAQWAEKLRELGSQRAAFTTCMTCWTAAGHNASWEADPVKAIWRASSDYRQHDLLARELRALELLVAAHRDEFTEALGGLGEVGDLAARRRARRRA